MEWTGARYADSPEVRLRTWIGAPPRRVWELVSDIAVMPTASAELRSVEWLDGATAAAPGARFRGRNRNDVLGEWQTISEVVECLPDTAFAWQVQGPEGPMATWRFELAAGDGGTELVHAGRMGPGRSGLSAAIDRMPHKEQKIVHNRLCEWERSIAATLENIKRRAEAA